MPLPFHRIAALCIFLFLRWGAEAQFTSVYVDSVTFEGNARTRAAFMQREMDIHPGDSIKLTDLMDRLKRNELLILNMGIFNWAQCNVSAWENDHLSISVKVQETWYIYPIPVVELADRNFNVWWVEQKRALNRLNFGLITSWFNFSGRNDLLKAVVQLGYIQKFELEYRRPFVNAKKPWGFSVNGLFSRNKELPFTTENNKLIFFRDFESKSFLFKRYRIGGTLAYRGGLAAKHELGLGYQYLEIADTVAALNPNYFLDGRKSQRSVNLFYRFTYDKRNIRPYPDRGYYIQATLAKNGVGFMSDLNLMSASAILEGYIPWKKRWHVSLGVRAKKSFLYERQPYYNQPALGYNSDYVRGYQYYVVDGQDYVLFQSDLHFKFLDIRFYWKNIWLKRLRNVSVRLYARLHGDAGYVWDRFYFSGNPLAKSWLLGAGVSLDLVAYYNFVLQADFTINRLGEKGIYLRSKVSF